MLRTIAIALIALTAASPLAQAQFPPVGPAIPPPPGGVPTTPSHFAPLTIPAPPPGWLAPAPAPQPHARHNTWYVYSRPSANYRWVFAGAYHQHSEAAARVQAFQRQGRQAFMKAW